MSDNGWISLHRKIMNHTFYSDKRTFSRFEAWVDLLLLANHKDNKFLLGNEFVEVKRGSFITSIRKLCTRWRWSNNKVVAFLKLLNGDSMIDYKSDTKKTVIAIVNYGLYQVDATPKASPKRHKSDANATPMHTNNNDNNDNNENKKTLYGDTVKLTKVEFDSLVSQLGSEERARRCIEIVDDYKVSNGKTYKSDYRAIKNWVITRLEEEEQKAARNRKPPGGDYARADDQVNGDKRIGLLRKMYGSKEDKP